MRGGGEGAVGMQSGGGERVLCRQQTAPNLGGSSFAQFCGLARPGLGVLLVSCDHHLMVATAGGSTETPGRRISSSSTFFLEPLQADAPCCLFSKAVGVLTWLSPKHACGSCQTS